MVISMAAALPTDRSSSCHFHNFSCVLLCYEQSFMQSLSKGPVCLVYDKVAECFRAVRQTQLQAEQKGLEVVLSSSQLNVKLISVDLLLDPGFEPAPHQVLLAKHRRHFRPYESFAMVGASVCVCVCACREGTHELRAQVLVLSHKWAYIFHPDAALSKDDALRELLEPCRGLNVGIFVDFFCLAQHGTFRD